MILDPENRWGKLSDCIPWDDLVESQNKTQSPTLESPFKDVRIMMGAVIIKP